MKAKRGFTLIELLVAVAIIAILVTGALVVVNPIQVIYKGRDSKRVQDLKEIQKALELYHQDSGQYPPVSRLSTTGANWFPELAPAADPNRYFKKGVPRDPRNIWGAQRYAYYYRLASGGKGYFLLAGLETVSNDLPESSDDVYLLTWKSCKNLFPPASSTDCVLYRNPF